MWWGYLDLFCLFQEYKILPVSVDGSQNSLKNYKPVVIYCKKKEWLKARAKGSQKNQEASKVPKKPAKCYVVAKTLHATGYKERIYGGSYSA